MFVMMFVGFAMPAMPAMSVVLVVAAVAFRIHPARPVSVVDFSGNGKKYSGTQKHGNKQINVFFQLGFLLFDVLMKRI